MAEFAPPYEVKKLFQFQSALSKLQTEKEVVQSRRLELLNAFQGTFTFFTVICKAALLEEYCAKYGQAPSLITEFIAAYSRLSALTYGQTCAEKAVAEELCGEEDEEEPSVGETRLTGVEICDLIVRACKVLCDPTPYYGVSTLAMFLKGGKRKGLYKQGLQDKELCGCLHFLKSRTIFDLIAYLCEADVLRKSTDLYPTVSVWKEKGAEEYDAVCIEEILARDSQRKPKREERKVARELATMQYKGFAVYVDEEGNLLTDLALLDRLKEIRTECTKQMELLPFQVCANRLLVWLATAKPTTREEFLQISGVGNRWYEKFSQFFLPAIKQSKKEE